VVACHDTEPCTGRRRTASHKAIANGTLALRNGEQAADKADSQIEIGQATKL